MEMELFLRNGTEKNNEAITIANFYNNAELPDDKGRDELKKLSEKENGLISWYIYSIFPYYFFRQDQHEATINFLENLLKFGNSISKYSALSALWLSKKYMKKHLADNVIENMDRIFTENARNFIMTHGGWLEINHLNTNGYNPPEKFIDAIQQPRNTGCSLTVNSNSIKFRYDSDILSYYIAGLAENVVPGNEEKENEVISDIISIIKNTIDNVLKNKTAFPFSTDDFLKYTLRCLAKTGESHPQISLKCLVNIYENKDSLFSEKISTVNLATEISISIARIGRIYPMHAKKAIEEFNETDKSLIVETFNQILDDMVGVSISTEGQSIYQRFMLDEKMRKTFSDGIIASGTTSKIDKFFLAYTEAFFELVSEIDLKNISVDK